MRRKLWLVSALATGSLVLAACGEAPDKDGDGGTGSGSGDYLACMVTDTGGIDDRSFNESAWAGLQQAAAEDDRLAEPRNVSSGAEADYVPNLTGFVDEGCDFILAVGGLMGEATSEVASAHPDQQFGIVDTSVGLANVYPMQFDTAQAAFLAGYLAAGYSSSGVVATYGGLQIGPVTIFMDGFVDGVAHYNEVHGTDVKVLGWDKESQTGAFAESFEDQAAGRSLSDSFVAQGADVIMPVAGGTGLGTAAAAAESGEYAVIWVDLDGCESVPQYCSVFLTTVVKNIPGAVKAAVLEAADAGDGLATGEYLGTLANGGVSLAPYHEFEDRVPDELKAEIEDLRQQIIDGEVTVTSPASPQ
ncbi:MAG TPA: BMP family ABC transporter substrate-binding protein [Natronosporangium sp.]|nr:BMP family ABC transporter substrate-binding protein [Natronosporangium sp.]